jgi:putative transcriptional regulator
MAARHDTPGVLAALAAGLALCAGGSGAQDRDVAKLEKGRLLYAIPGLPDPNFAESVVLLVRREQSGTTGLIVNVPTSTTVGEALPALDGLPGSGLPVHRGGPVQATTILFLVRSKAKLARLTHVAGEVYFGARAEDLRDALSRPDATRNVRVFAGYAGWTRSQLETELRGGGWVLGARDPQAAFTRDPSQLWPRVRSLLRKTEARLAAPAGSPRGN